MPTELKRQSTDLLFFGLKGAGKTLAVSFYAYCEFLKGRNIFANYHLNIPYTHVGSLMDLKLVKDGIVIFDDAERLVSSKFLSNRDKKDVLNVLIDSGKHNVDCWFICKRLEEVDKSIRSVCQKFIRVTLQLKYDVMSADDYLDLSRYLDNYLVKLEMFDRYNLNKSELIEYIDYLPWWSFNLYETTEEVQPFSLPTK